MTRPFRYFLATTLGALALAVHAPASAALSAGEAAPTFTTQAALAGEPFVFDLAQALQRGPVVLYFYPAAFTKGCTIEAQAFADAIEDFKALDATVVGVSGDDIDTLKKFSLAACASKFAVATDSDHRIMQAYDAALASRPGMADRISYVISPAGTVVYALDGVRPHEHVTNTLEAVRRWKTKATQAPPAK